MWQRLVQYWGCLNREMRCEEKRRNDSHVLELNIRLVGSWGYLNVLIRHVQSNKLGEKKTPKKARTFQKQNWENLLVKCCILPLGALPWVVENSGFP